MHPDVISNTRKCGLPAKTILSISRSAGLDKSQTARFSRLADGRRAGRLTSHEQDEYIALLERAVDIMGQQYEQALAN